MQKLFKKKDKNPSKKNMPTSIQEELNALWSGDTMDFEMEGESCFIAFIMDKDDE